MAALACTLTIRSLCADRAWKATIAIRMTLGWRVRAKMIDIFASRTRRMGWWIWRARGGGLGTPHEPECDGLQCQNLTPNLISFWWIEGNRGHIASKTLSQQLCPLGITAY